VARPSDPPGEAAGPADHGRFGDAVLLEREEELAALRAGVHAAARGDGSLVLIEGQAGVGKTSLIRAAGAAARAAGVLTLEATALELEREVPGSVARKLLMPLLPRGGSPQRRQLLRGLDPVLAPVLDGAPSAAPPGGEDQQVAVTMALATLFERLLAGPAANGLALLVDDAHWADAVSLRLLSYLLLESQGLAFALIFALRSEERLSAAAHALRASPRARVLRPALLTPGAAAGLIRRSMPGADAQFCQVCAQACAGNPFLLGELLRALHEEGIRGSAADAVRAEEFLPDSVLSAVLVRLARLGEAPAQLARAASVLGEAPLRQVAALARLTGEAAEDAADRLLAAGLIVGRERISFAHPLVQAAIYRDQMPFARARAHRQAAGILAADGARIESVAAHLQLARPDGDPWVLDQLLRAAARALGDGDPQTSEALLERALREPPAPERRAGVLLALADTRAAGGLPGAVECARAALDLIAAPQDRAAALYHLGVLLLARSDLAGAAACAEQGLREAEEGGDLAAGLEGILLASAVLVPELHERVAGRIAQLRAAALAGTDPADPVALAVLSLHMVNRGDDHQVVRRLAARALTASEGRGTVRAAMINQIGSALVYLEAFDLVEQELTKVIDQAGDEGRVLTAAFARAWRAAGRLRRGDLAGTIADAELALELRHFGWHLHIGPCSAFLVLALLEVGDLTAAKAALEAAAAVTDVPRQPLLLEARARLALALGDPRSAIDDIQTANAFLYDTHGLDNPSVLPWRTVHALALAKLGDAGPAVELALEEAALARRLRTRRAEGVALIIAGTLTRGAGGIELLEQAQAILAGTPCMLEHAHALVELGAILRRERQRAAARAPLRRALEQATVLGAVPLADRALGELRATGAHPRREMMHGADSLTPTEKRIAELASRGLSNRAIADKLVVTPKTVEWHLGRIYTKLSVAGRGDLAAAGL
jgi:DNA-binding CsgD family transcriptional regulator